MSPRAQLVIFVATLYDNFEAMAHLRGPRSDGPQVAIVTHYAFPPFNMTLESRYKKLVSPLKFLDLFV